MYLKENTIVYLKENIRLLLRKYKQTSSLHDLPRGPSKKLTVEHYCYKDKGLSQDDETTCVQLHILLYERFTNINVSFAASKEQGKILGWYQALHTTAS